MSDILEMLFSKYYLNKQFSKTLSFLEDLQQQLSRYPAKP